MKKSFFRFCLLSCIPLFSIACSHSEKLSDNEFLIEGRITDVEDGAVIRLFRMDGDVGMNIASDTLRNGRFIFKEEAVSDTERLTIMSFDEGFLSMSLDVWVKQGIKVKINGKGKLIPTWEVKSSVPNQKEENLYAKKSRNIIAEISRISIERNGMRTKMMTASGDDALAYRKAFDSLVLISNELRANKNFADIGIMEKTNISNIWLEKMREIASYLRFSNSGNESDKELRKKAEALYDRMSEENKTTPLGYRITAFLFPPPIAEVGDDMADADFFDINGHTKHLSDYSGKYLLLDFWSSGCGPCLMAFPEMKEISETFSEKLTIVSISLDTDARWKEAMTQHDMPWVNIRDPKGYGGLAANYGVNGIPYYVIILPEGKVVDKWMGFGHGLITRKLNENVK